MGDDAAVGPWVGKVVERQSQSLATPEGEQDGRDSRSGFVAAADLAAIAAVRLHTHQSAPTLQPGDSGGEPDLWGTVGLEASHDHFRYSEGTVQQDIQDLLDSVDQDSDGVDVDVESAAVQTARCSAQLGSPG